MSAIPVILLAFANEKHGDRYLNNLVVEQAELRAALETAEDAGLCEVVMLANATVEDMLDTFQKAKYKDRIAVFHYAGHADGYQLLLESRELGNVTAHGAGLVSFLGKQTSLKLIFLNGCSTQQQAEELIEAGVPAVIGTATSIADDIALMLATRFYNSIANGAPLARAWREAEDEVKIRRGTGNTRSLYWEDSAETIADHFPWSLYIREGSDIVRTWNLPDSVNNPLFGLPPIPQTHPLPEEPYIFLRRFERKHAEVFFGRSYYVRDLYNRVTDPKSAPVIQLYGQSGVGKSSFFDAGLNPRLEQTHFVCYLRREQSLGLLQTVLEGVANIAAPAQPQLATAAAESETPQAAATTTHTDTLRQLADTLPQEIAADIRRAIRKMERNATTAGNATQSFDTSTDEGLLGVWKRAENALQKPVIIILDQVEELFTRPNEQLPLELDDFLGEIKRVFASAKPPKGKLILGYRKEYFAEIEEKCKLHEIPRSAVFLDHLNKKDIAEVVTGLTQQPHVRQKYRLTVDSDLPELIGSDLLEDKDSPIAPVLQILLTKMWTRAIHEDETPQFRAQDYQHLKREGILMDDFFVQQMAALEAWNPELVRSGLALDILMRHTTRLGTATTRTSAELHKQYDHRKDILGGLLTRLSELYLLSGSGSDSTGLAHDTLAPIVQRAFRESDYPGQIASRILSGRVLNFDDENPEKTALDATDLEIVERGLMGMRKLEIRELRLISASRKRRLRALTFRRTLIGIGVTAAITILIISGLALQQRNKAQEQAQKAEKAAKEANIASKKAIKERQNAQWQTSLANLEKQRAEIEARRAEVATNDAEEKRKIAESATEEAQAAEIAAKAAKDAAELARNAETAQREAAIAAQIAAEQRRKEAEKARIRADSSHFLAVAHELAIKSQILENSRSNEALRQKLAYLAYRLHSSNNGDTHDADIYDALNKATYNIANREISTGGSATSEIAAITFVKADKFAAATRDGRTRIWSSTNPKFKPTELTTPEGGYSHLLCELKSERLYAVGELDHNVYFYDLNTNIAMRPSILIELGAEIEQFAFVPTRNWLVTVRNRQELTCWDAATENKRMLSLTLPHRAMAVAASYDGMYLYIGTEFRDNANSVQGELLRINLSSTTPRAEVLYTYEDASIRSIAIHPNGKTLLVGLNTGGLHSFNVEAKTYQSLSGHLAGTPISAVGFLNDGLSAISVGFDGTVRQWNYQNLNDEPMELARHTAYVRKIAISPDKKIVISTGDDRLIHFSETRISALAKPLQNIATKLRLTPAEWAQFLDGIPYGRVSPLRD